ncbi:cysteine rich repeat-containing protein [Amaricoccus sp.]|uniref:cysteine rich repeat-containing protein n=1 Tax=Amaricoccus sp. TaxID=1872485 RepID=UPI002627E2E7|nr:cysteine rich repeat-containing protein [Amaricoccus sp.]HRO11874.1 cysteine rich repeat-containing protein [Amaricoccus sp.]
MSRSRLLPLAALLAGLTLPGAPARADLMTTCAPDIQRFCSDVRNGRGRISACLASEMGSLGGACRGEVQQVMQSPLTPGYVRRALDPSFSAPLPASCVGPAKSLCPDIPAGQAQVFACLYARSDRAGKTCSDAATSTLKSR